MTPPHAATGPEPDAQPEDTRGGGAWFARVNPAAKLIVALIAAAGLIPVIDVVTSGVVLAGGLCLLAVSGIERRLLLALAGPFVLMGCSIGLVNLVFGDEGAMAALGTALRIMAIALPGILAGATSDPTDLTDALVQRLKIPERPAVGVLAALRLVPLLAAQWRTLTLARRARGIEAGRNPFRAVTIFVGKTFALLVRSIRTGTLLAMAMDARAFAAGPRSHARLSRWRARDTWLIAASVVLVACAHALAIAVGTWQPLFM
ncbi:energy-coupling factor transporter transmembrane component T family protein [Salinactinospora qingdaonensis]|uniref:Energy-coupling factor transporter transmembrane component T n=1 Tax=Salinactinospora qingdaonensis TaxID=702744 RepID=A0ABP7GQB1_9ACTN